MSGRQELLINSLSCQLKAARRELAALRSGETCARMRREYEAVIREKDRAIEKLRKERDGFSFSRKQITRQWQEVLEDVQAEHEKEARRLKKLAAELLDLIASLKNRNRELDEKRKEALHNYYETARMLEEAQGMILKLQAQVNHNYENSSLPSSKCIGRRKITNNRERTGRKPGAQEGHPHHGRKAAEGGPCCGDRTGGKISGYLPVSGDGDNGCPPGGWSGSDAGGYRIPYRPIL